MCNRYYTDLGMETLLAKAHFLQSTQFRWKWTEMCDRKIFPPFMTFRVYLDTAYLLKIENLLLKILWHNFFKRPKHCSRILCKLSGSWTVSWNQPNANAETAVRKRTRLQFTNLHDFFYIHFHFKIFLLLIIYIFFYGKLYMFVSLKVQWIFTW